MIKLTPEQEEDATAMVERQDLPNFSKAGTGKTHTTLRAVQKFNPKRSLVLCPPIAVRWWQEQAIEFLGVDAQVLTGGGNKIKGEMVITTYDIARNARARLYETFTEGALILDESHYVRNVTALRTQAVFGNHADGGGGLVERFDTAWCLSGTPMEAYANDLWTQTGTLHPEIYEEYDIHDYEDFCARFTYKRKKQFHPRMQPQWKISGNTNEKLLNRIIYEELGALRRQEAPGLPALRVRRLPVKIKLSAEVRRIMAGLSIEEIIQRINADDEIMAKIWKVVGLAKVHDVVPYGMELMNNGPVLFGCWHKDVMQAYYDAFTAHGYKVAQVHGGISGKKREDIRIAFNKGQLDAIIGQMRAMGVSWNLQEACSNIVITEVHPSPAVVEQFYKRVYRYGQELPCQLDMVIADEKLDIALDGVRVRKAASDMKING